MFWLMLLALMLLIPTMAAVQTCRDLRQEAPVAHASTLTYVPDVPADAGVAHGGSNT